MASTTSPAPTARNHRWRRARHPDRHGSGSSLEQNAPAGPFVRFQREVDEASMLDAVSGRSGSRRTSRSQLWAVLGIVAAATTIAHAQPPPAPEPTPPTLTPVAAPTPVTTPVADEPTARATRHLDRGKALITAGQYDKAIEQFQLSYAIVQAPQVQFEIAEAYRARNDAKSALHAYRGYLVLVSEGELAAHARTRIIELTAALKQIEAARAEYPLIVTDRPILLSAGMTAIDFSLNLPTYDLTAVDTMGNVTTTRTRLGERFHSDFGVRHAFGRLQLSGGSRVAAKFDSYYLGAAIQTGDVPGSVSLTLAYYRAGGVDYAFTESISYAHRLFRIQGRFVLYGGASAAISEVSVEPPMGISASGSSVSLSAFGSAIVQLTPRLSVGVYPSFRAEVRNSYDAKAPPTLGEVTQTTLALGRWDVYGQFGLSNLTDAPRPFASFGAVCRF